MRFMMQSNLFFLPYLLGDSNKNRLIKCMDYEY